MSDDLRPRYTIAECRACGASGRSVDSTQPGKACGVCFGDRYVFVDGRPTDATHYVDHSAHLHRCVRCTPQQEVA